MNGFLLFRLFNPEDPLPMFGPVSPAMRERLVLVGAVLLILIAAVAGLIVLREFKHRRSRRHEYSRRRRPFHRTATGVAELKRMIPEKPRRRREHRRREHRPRNPTLAETGGLPPLRSDHPLEPPHPRTRTD